MGLKYHVTFGDKKKIIEFDADNDTEASHFELVCALSTKFDLIGTVNIQYFNNDFNDWVDISDGDKVATMSRLRVLKLVADPHPVEDPHPVDQTTSVIDTTGMKTTACVAEPNDR